MQETDHNTINSIFELQKTHAKTIYASTAKERLQKIDRIHRYLSDANHVEELKAALYKD